MNSTDHVVITVHGIRTFGAWQERLERIVNKDGADIAFWHYKFGYFSVLAFLVPVVRQLVVRRFRKELEAVIARARPKRVDIVSHSFGTYLVGWGLVGLSPKDPLQIHTLILAGSVLRSNFFWPALIPSRVARVINDCGTKDSLLLLSQFLVLFTGMAGRLGFIGMTGKELVNRYSDFGHSGYFLNANGDADDAYMSEHWAPLLTKSEPVKVFDSRKNLGALSAVGLWFANNFEPLKLTLYLTPVAITAVILGAAAIQSNLARERVEAIFDLSRAMKGRKSVENSTEQLLSTIERAAQIPLKHTYVIWLDDKVDNNDFERAALRRFGVCFLTARTTDEAVRALKADPDRYSALISNFERPNDPQKGYGILDQIKALKLKVPVIYYVFNVNNEQIEDAKKQGAVDEVIEPLSLFNRLLSTVNPSGQPVGRLRLIVQQLFYCPLK